MAPNRAAVVICGAGIAGISAAFYLAVRHGVRDVVLVDPRPPLSLTSDKSTEAYRNWWPGPGDDMARFMNRSIDLLEELARETGNRFLMNRRGYAFFTADGVGARSFQETGEAISALGAGPLRIHPGSHPYAPSPGEGFEGQPTGADLLLDPALIRRHFSFVSQQSVAMLHARRCGWLSAQQLGSYLLEEARKHGVRLVMGEVTGVLVERGRVTGVRVGAETIAAENFVIAAGPLAGEAAAMMGVELPLHNELHGKISFADYLGIVPRDAPLMIWSDPVSLVWNDQERAALSAEPETAWLLQTFPAGVHFRPEGGAGSDILLGLWTYDVEATPPTWPPRFPESYAEIVLRGLARMTPGLEAYVERPRKLFVDGGYYCKTPENRPLITPLPVTGAFLIGALSGFGIMASQAAGELLAAHVTGGSLPAYSDAFHMARYDDPRYRAELANWDSAAGQL
jgi:glycine/D-amino acid oxidase-like deaminating enzyme